MYIQGYYILLEIIFYTIEYDILGYIYLYIYLILTTKRPI